MGSKSASTIISLSRLSRANCGCSGLARCFDAPEPRHRQPGGGTIVRFGRFTFSLERGELRAGDEHGPRCQREREMLRLLSANAGAIVSAEALSGSGGQPGPGAGTVDVLVNRLRRKIEQDPAQSDTLCRPREERGYRLIADR